MERSVTMEQAVIYVVDDDPGVLRGLDRLLRQQGYTTRLYESPAAFIRELDPDAPGCVLLDLSLPGVNGLELQEQLLAAGCWQPIVFMTGYGTVQASVRAMKAGAIDFIEKPIDANVLTEVLQRAIDRDRSARISRNDTDAIAKRLASLTPRENEVLRHVVAGRLNKQIAGHLGTAEKTVKVHRARIMHKMSVRSVAELTRMTIAAGVQPAP